MSRYSVDTDALLAASGACTTIGDSIFSLGTDILYAKGMINDSFGRYSGVMESLNTCFSNTRKCYSKTLALGGAGKQISKLYLDAENNVLVNSGHPLGLEETQIGETNVPAQEPTGIGAPAEAVTESTWPGEGADVAEWLSYLLTILAGAASNFTEAGIALTVEGDALSTIANYLDDVFSFSDFNVAQGLTYASFVAVLFADGFSNYQEYKDGSISKERAINEFVLESIIDIGAKGILLPALIAGGLAAVGIAAPAVVAVAAVGVSLLADVICESLTGEKLTEWVSDGILDFAEAAKSKIGSGIASVADTVKGNLQSAFAGAFG